MSTRIRYDLKSNGTKESTQTFLTNKGETVKVIVDGLTFRIFDTAVVNDFLAAGEAKNQPELKKAIKGMLVGLGVQFQAEVRAKKAKVPQEMESLGMGFSGSEN